MSTALERSAARRGPEWDERSLLPDQVGIPWWAAICLALGLTAAGVFVDLQRLDQLGIIFQVCYFLGCVLAVTLVQRKGLFGPMVQPPLILALAVPSVVVAAGSVPTDGGTAATALAVGTPLINGFPTMALTTGATLAVGALRLLTQRPPQSTSATRRLPASPRTAGADTEPVPRVTGERPPDQPRKPSPQSRRPPEQARRSATELPRYPVASRQPASRPATRRDREPDSEPITEPVPRVTGGPAPRYEPPRPDRRRRRS